MALDKINRNFAPAAHIPTAPRNATHLNPALLQIAQIVAAAHPIAAHYLQNYEIVNQAQLLAMAQIAAAQLQDI